MGRTKEVLTNLVLLIAGSIIAIVGAEIAFRFFGFDIKKDYLYPRYYYRAIDEAGFDLAENFPSTPFCVDGNCFPIWTNEIGCFDKSVLNIKDNIMLVGDSFTWGLAPYEDIYGTGIENITGKKVIKCGVGSYGIKHQLLKAKRIYKKLSIINENKTKLIVLGYFWNDWLDDWTFPNSTVIDGFMVQSIRVADWKSGEIKVTSHSELQQKYQAVKSENESRVVRTWLSDNSIIVNYIRNLSISRNILNRMGMAKQRPLENGGEFKYYSLPFYGNLEQLPSWISLSWDKHIENIREIKRFAESINARFLVVLIPDKSAVYKYMHERATAQTDYKLNNIRYPHKIIMDSLRKGGIEYLDLLPELRQRADQKPKMTLNYNNDFYYPHDPHMSPSGQRFTALVVSKYIIQNNLVDLPEGREIILQEIEDNLKRY